METGIPPLESPEFTVFYEGFTMWFGTLWDFPDPTSMAFRTGFA